MVPGPGVRDIDVAVLGSEFIIDVDQLYRKLHQPCDRWPIKGLVDLLNPPEAADISNQLWAGIRIGCCRRASSSRNLRHFLVS